MAGVIDMILAGHQRIRRLLAALREAGHRGWSQQRHEHFPAGPWRRLLLARPEPAIPGGQLPTPGEPQHAGRH